MTTLPADELVARLRRIADQMERFLGPPEMAPGPDPDDLTDAADLIEAQATEISSLRAKLAWAMEVVRALVNAPIWVAADTPDGPERPAVTPAELIAPLRAARRFIEENGK